MVLKNLFTGQQWTSLVAQMVKRLSTMQETWVRSLGWEDPLEKEMATHSSTLAWKIPCTEEPCRLQSMWSQRVRHDWAMASYHMHICQVVRITHRISVMITQKCVFCSCVYHTRPGHSNPWGDVAIPSPLSGMQTPSACSFTFWNTQPPTLVWLRKNQERKIL